MLLSLGCFSPLAPLCSPLLGRAAAVQIFYVFLNRFCQCGLLSWCFCCTLFCQFCNLAYVALYEKQPHEEVISPLLLETQTSTAEFIFVCNMHQMLCEWTVGGLWARHLRLRQHSNSQVRQHARVACGCCCLSDTDQ